MKSRVWDSYTFSSKPQKSALDLLHDFKEDLIAQTSGELAFETEAVDAYFEGKLAAIYKLFVVAPKLGHFRRKILSIAEFSDRGRFPIDLVNHFDSDKKYQNISEADFVKAIEDVLISPLVKNSIENLYKQSKEYGS